MHRFKKTLYTNVDKLLYKLIAVVQKIRFKIKPTYNNVISIYTDASHKYNTKKYGDKNPIFGYAAVILHKNEKYILKGYLNRKHISSHFKISSVNINSVELIAIAKALYQFRNYKSNTPLTLNIFTDSKVAMHYIKLSVNKTPSKAISKKYLNISDFISNVINRIHGNGNIVNIEWVKAHNGNHGNALADKYANTKDLFIHKNKIDKMTAHDFYKKEINEFIEFIDHLHKNLLT